MSEANLAIFTIGSLFVLGLIADIVGRKTFLPRVTILLLCGVLVGPQVLDLLPRFFVDDWFEVITDISLGMIGFLLGQKLTLPKLFGLGKAVITISLFKVLITFVIVLGSLYALTSNLQAAILLAAIASPSAPAAIYDLIQELRVQNSFSDKLLSIVAIDDLWGIVLFVFSLSFVAILGANSDWVQHLQHGFVEIFGSIGLGVGFGLVVAWITGRIQRGEPTQAEALGAIFLTISLATYFELSPLLSAVVLGITVANVAKHHNTPFEAIKGFEWPFLIIFFLLAGASLHLDALLSVGFIGAAYILSRACGIFLGAYIGAKKSAQDSFTQKNLGLTLLPQAGVAVGMALMAAQSFGELKDIILPVVIGATVVFELLGPILARRVLQKAKD
ncbi:MAG: cation:proton antiporter [Campylobacterota bacterium]